MLFSTEPGVFWRARCKGWNDSGFLERLMRTLHDAVHTGNSTARNTMNLSVTHPLWVTFAWYWQPFMDVIGLSVYPNYYGTYPEPPQWLVAMFPGLAARYLILAHFPTESDAAMWLATNVAMAHAVAGGKPVMVMETGLKSGPGWAESFGPRAFPTSLTEESQASYLRLAACAAVSAGADGFFWHKLYDSSYKDYQWEEWEWGLLTYGDGGTPEPKQAFGTYQDIIADYAAASAGP
jgi:hypothetical protein